jgi:DNA-binding CsgD family transcriptional regulator
MVESKSHKDKLSAREYEILKLVSTGNTTNEISSILNIDPETVISYRKNLLKKFKVRNCAELIYVVTKLGLI